MVLNWHKKWILYTRPCQAKYAQVIVQEAHFYDPSMRRTLNIYNLFNAPQQFWGHFVDGLGGLKLGLKMPETKIFASPNDQPNPSNLLPKPSTYFIASVSALLYVLF